MDRLVNTTFSRIFRNKRIFITGDTGFKGSWLSLWLHQLGADVLGYALRPAKSQRLFNQLQLPKRIHHINGDIRDLSHLRKITLQFRPEFLFHLAAQPLVRYSYNHPKETFDVNVGGSVNILEIVRQTPTIRSVIYVTTDKCYKNKEWIWGYRENDELGGKDPYSASKAAAEIAIAAYRDSFFKGRRLGTASVRAGNVIGGGDWSEDRIVPDCIRSLQRGQPIKLRHPSSVRPWQHVLDPLCGYLQLAVALYRNPKVFSSAWNFAPLEGPPRTVRQLAGELIRYWGDGKIRLDIKSRSPHEAAFLRLNCEKAHSLLNWFPRWNFEQSIEKTVRWYKAIQEGESAYLVSTQQISDYMSLTPQRRVRRRPLTTRM